jgi:hypothetical protein
VDGSPVGTPRVRSAGSSEETPSRETDAQPFAMLHSLKALGKRHSLKQQVDRVIAGNSLGLGLVGHQHAVAQDIGGHRVYIFG